MSDSDEPFVLILGVQLHDVVADQVVLDELPEVVLVASGGSDEQLSRVAVTLAVEVFMAGLASSLSMSEN